MEVSWEGPDTKDRMACPYPVNFLCKPVPAENLNSLEAGRLLLRVDLGTGIKSVTVRIVNNAKRERLHGAVTPSELEHKTSLSANLVRDSRRIGAWTGELSIPSSWMEGGTRTYERTGSATRRDESLYSLEIRYALDAGNNCTARFMSSDAFHWRARARDAYMTLIVYKSLKAYGH